MTNRLPYRTDHRPEIDGLRALAVLPVILFHAGVPGFGGGYVGVDVFFVISGYLITRLILADLEAGRFSLLSFYERRARRILPALFVMILACIPFAMLWMLPAEFKDFSQSLIAVSLFASNVLFWRETDYFSTAAEEKPLLHTWSLAVEEQYYLLFPLFLILAWRFGRDPVFYVTAALALVSFALAELGARYAPDATFYLPHGRAWELLAGSLCAFAQPRLRSRAYDGLAALGIALIVGAVMLFDSATPMPSAYALAPVGGAALVILFARSDTFSGRALGTPILVGIGLISYSAYLYHYPIFAFARLRGLPVDSLAFMLALSVFALVVGWMSWRFVERPFRYEAGRSTKPLLPGRTPVLAASGAFAALILSLGFVGSSTDIRYDRFSPDIASLLRGYDDFRPAMKAYGLGTCFIDYHQTADTLVDNDCLAPTAPGTRRVVLFGDSLAAHLSLGLEEALADRPVTFSQYTGTECAPLRHANLMPRCADLYDRFLADAARAGPSTIILSGNWRVIEAEAGETVFKALLTSTVSRLESAGHEVVLVAQTPSYESGGWLREIAIRGSVEEIDRSISDDFRPANAVLRRFAEARGTALVDLTSYLCEADSLDCAVTVDGTMVYTDRMHVTPDISRFYGRVIADVVFRVEGLALNGAS